MPNYYSYDLKIKIVELYFFKQFDVLKISNLFNISKSSIYNWIKLYSSNSLNKTKQKYVLKNSKFRNIDIRNAISSYTTKKPCFNYITLLNYIKRKTNIKISKSCLYSILTDLNITKKFIKFKKSYKCKKQIYKIKKLAKIIKNINYNNVISIDEVSFDTNIIKKVGWSKKGIKIFKNINATYKRITVICAISNKQLLHHKILNNSANAIDFKQFILELENKIILNNKILFLDNARIHHSKIIKTYILNKTFKLLFNIPYCPQFNPIECVFSKLKYLVKNFNNNNILENLIFNVVKSFKKLNYSLFKDCFNYSFSNLLYYLNCTYT